jgi:hypothetical protein
MFEAAMIDSEPLKKRRISQFPTSDLRIIDVWVAGSNPVAPTNYAGPCRAVILHDDPVRSGRWFSAQPHAAIER